MLRITYIYIYCDRSAPVTANTSQYIYVCVFSFLALQLWVGPDLLNDFVTVNFSGVGSEVPRPTTNPEDQGLHFVWPLPFDLSRMGGQDSNSAHSEHIPSVFLLLQPVRFHIFWAEMFFSAPCSRTPSIISCVDRSGLTIYTKPQVYYSSVPILRRV
jgi:hypothetical protein